MRVLHVVSSAQRRGAEMFACDLDKALADLGVDQRIAQLRSVSSKEVVDFFSPTDVLVGPGVRPSLGTKFKTVRSLRRLVTSWAPDVVQAHGGEALKYAVPACRGRAPVVYRRIGSTPPWMAGGVRRAGHGAIMRRAERVVAVSEATRAETTDIFRLDAGRVVTIPNGVDVQRATPLTERTTARAGLDIDPSAPVVISVGAFTEEKDPGAQVRIALRVLERRPEAVFLMVGDGPLAARTQGAVTAAGMDRSIRLLGTRADVPDLLFASDVLLLASRTEGMPGILIEAGIAGLPAAAYALAGVPEVVEDGRTGVLAPPGDVAALAAGVLKLLDDEAARRAMSEAARARCTERFDIRAVAATYRSLYDELTKKRTGDPSTDEAVAR